MSIPSTVHRHISGVLAVLALAALATASPGLTPTRGGTATCGADWTVAVSANHQGASNGLAAVEATSDSDAWAVGSLVHRPSNAFSPLAEHWDGSRWRLVDSPSFPDVGEFLAVDATAQDDVWAVGAFQPGPNHPVPLIEHWNGSRWTRFRAPRGVRLTGVAAISRTDAWAVGIDGLHTMIVHWDGTTWNRVPTPSNGPDYNFLYGVGAAGPDDIWAVGTFRDDTQGFHYKTLTLHWDGSTWSLVPSANRAHRQVQSGLNGVAGSGGDVWAIGAYTGRDDQSHPLIEHWDGSAWSLVPAPRGVPGRSFLRGVTALGADDVWAVGSAAELGLIEHWDGSTWSEIRAPEVGDVDGFQGIGGSASRLWAVGFKSRTQNRFGETLVEQACGL